MSGLLGYLVLFVLVGVGFVFVHLMIGKMIRPAKPDPDKLTIYECGEPTIGSAWVQFDLRFYVVALLFVIFDVEMAFFFPWAVVFGKTNELARDTMTLEQREQPTAIISMAQQARPKVIGHMLDSRAQLIACSSDVVMTLSSNRPSSQPIVTAPG